MNPVTVTLEEGIATKITARQHTWYSDEPEQDGGHDEAPKPTEMLMASLGSCMAITMKLYAQRKEWPLEKVEVFLDYERFNGADYEAYDGNAPFIHEIRERVVLHGPLTDDQKKRILEIGEKCPVRRVLANPTFFVEGQPNPEV